MTTLNAIGAPNVNKCLFYGNGATYTNIATANNGVMETDSSGVPSIGGTLPSAVQANITQVGTITSGTWNGTKIGIAYGGTNATSFTQTNGIVAYNGTSLVNYAGPQLDSSGRYTNTSQPAFIANSPATTANVTGNGTVYTVVFTNTLLNQGSGFDGTSTFTAPVTGRYFFTANPAIIGIISSHTAGTMTLVTTGGTYTFWNCSPYAASTNSGGLRFSGGILVPMTAGDTAVIQITVSNGTEVVNVQSVGTFTGYLAN